MAICTSHSICTPTAGVLASSLPTVMRPSLRTSDATAGTCPSTIGAYTSHVAATFFGMLVTFGSVFAAASRPLATKLVMPAAQLGMTTS